MNNRAGELVNNLSGDIAYKSFKPAALPPQPTIEVTEKLLHELIDAHKKIAKLEGMSSRIASVDLFISMYVRKEALLSSQIEGTQCTLDDILNPNVEKNTNLDVSDVLNYVKATEYAINRLESLPLCCRLIKETHKVLLDNVRGQEKNPGEFRTSQNWIGGQGCTLKSARYIPPNTDDMTEALSNLEKFINYDDSLDPLIQIALIHYQFETIHPFLDGNGRVGRLLITLFLIEKKLISRPILYTSLFLKMNRTEYYDRMTQVRNTGNYEQWVEFFLNALSNSAEDAIETIEKLSNLYEQNYLKISNMEFGKRKLSTVKIIFSYLEKSPIIDIKKTSLALGLSYNTVSSVVKELQQLGILVENTNQERNRTFSYEEYLKILRLGV